MGGGSWSAYTSALTTDLNYLEGLGETVTDSGQLWAFIVQQAIGFSPIQQIGQAVDAQLPTPGLSLEFTRSFAPSIVGRNQNGPLGYGWSDNWRISLSVESNGTVVVSEPGDAQRTFTPTGNGAYLAEPGDYGVLTALPNGVFSLQEKDGTLTEFNPVSNGQATLDYVQDTNNNRITAGYNTNGQLVKLTDSSANT